jgi:hypothetical protein
MKTIFLKPTLNPAFKTTQPLPLLPAGFVAKRAWAARPFSAPVSPAEAFRLDGTAAGRCPMPLQHEIHPQVARLVA